MMTIKTIVKEAHGKGVGVFSVGKVKKGEVVWLKNDDFTKFYSVEEVAAMEKTQREFIEKYGYVVPGKEDVWELDLDDGRFMNHDDDPNTEYNDVEGWAVRDIEAGEEITCDYRTFDIAPLHFLNTK